MAGAAPNAAPTAIANRAPPPESPPRRAKVEMGPEREQAGDEEAGLAGGSRAILGGKFSDRGVMRAMIVMLAAPTAAPLPRPALALVMAFLWPVAAFQTGVADQAAEAANPASTIGIGAFNLGNAGGAFPGAVVIDSGFGLQALPVAAGERRRKRP